MRFFQEKVISDRLYSEGASDSIELVRNSPTLSIGILIKINYNATGLSWEQIKTGAIANLLRNIRLVKNGNITLFDASGQDLYLLNILYGLNIIESFDITDGTNKEGYVQLFITSPRWLIHPSDFVIASNLYNDLRLEIGIDTATSILTEGASGSIEINNIQVKITQVDYIREDFYKRPRLEMKIFKETWGLENSRERERDLQYDKAYLGILLKSTTNGVITDNIELLEIKRSNVIFRQLDETFVKAQNSELLKEKYYSNYLGLGYVNFVKLGQLSDLFDTAGMVDLKLKYRTKWDSALECIYLEAVDLEV